MPGYRDPPKATQFKPGKSGNPKGRPKGSLNLATDLTAELGEEITINAGGRPKRVTKQRALVKALTAKALEGDIRATGALLALHARLSAEPPPDETRTLEQDELFILGRFGPGLLKTLRKKGTRK